MTDFMTAKPEILFLVHRIPYPPDKGDKIRSWRLFRHLTRRFQVHLACFVDDPSDYKHTEKLRAMCASAIFSPLSPKVARLKSTTGFLTGKALSFPYYQDGAMARWVEKVRVRPLVAEIVFSSTMTQYIAEPVLGRPRIVDFCDADSEKWLQYAEETGGPLGIIYNREGGRLARAETVIANWADASFAVTADEAEIFNRRKDIEKKVCWWSNGVDTNYFDPSACFDNIVDRADIVFTGAMDYRANVDAVLYFVGKVWPKLRQAIPHATFAIVGARPASVIKALDGEQGVRVTGRVDDVRPWLNQATLVVAPLRVARGVQNKVLEAMAMAKPVVASPEAATGITPGMNGAICIGEDAAKMADIIIRLMNDPTERRRVGDRARACALAHYNWDVQLERFDRALAAVLPGYSQSFDDQSSRSASSEASPILK
jgi:sugar transferase (PEP-CTERM/EpsH1 system associated)